MRSIVSTGGYTSFIQLAQKLLARYGSQWLQYANKIILLARENNTSLKKFIMIDEAHFHLNGHVNK